MGQEILPFLIEVPEAALSDLRRRLLGVPARAAATIPAVGGEALHRHQVLGRTRTRRALRAFEQPELFVDEIRAFFRLVR